jgi:putative flippase GtrA
VAATFSLGRLGWPRYVRLARRFSKFALVGASGSAFNVALFWLLTEQLQLHYLVASALSFELAMFSNYLLNNNWTFADRKPGVFSLRGLLSYQVVALGSLGVTLVVVHVLVDVGGFYPAAANLIGIVCASAWNFCFNCLWTWRSSHSASGQGSVAPAQTWLDQERIAFAHDTRVEPPMATVEVSLVIPTYNEMPNIRPLLAELNDALVGTTWEAVFVDDSNDGTADLIALIAAADPRVRVIHRDVNRGGLAGAVVDGLAHAAGTYVCVLDADLQHPPSGITHLLAEVRTTNADVVIASRYLPGGSSSGLDGALRHFYSRGLRFLSRGFFPRRLANITDPLGGYFLVRRSVVQAVGLRPIGYKILLEVLVRCPWQASVEVPYAFQPRRHGASKANFAQGLRFLQHLSTLAWDCSPALAAPRFLLSAGARKADPNGAASR